MDVFPGEVIVDDINSMHRKTTAPCRWGSMSLALDNLAAASETLVGHPITRPLVTMVIRPSRVLMSRLLGLHETAGRLAATAPDMLANPQVARALENALTDAMIMCLADSTTVERNANNLRHSVLMARLEEVLSAHESVPLYVAEICTAIAVSERTLRACCQKQLGMSPIRYLWLRRMHLARRALVRAAPGTSTVTRIAADHGFWELGRFAVEYRTLFGDSPSETLRRSPRDYRFAPAVSEFA
jgi:AraC-like DNA-binding protein